MSISVILIRGIMAEVQTLGFDARALLKQCGIEDERLRDMRASLSIGETETLLLGATELTGEPALGLLAGSSAPDNILQVVGLMIRAQRTLRDAFQILLRYAPLIARGPRWQLVENAELATFSITPSLRRSPTMRILMDYALVLTVRVGRQFLPPDEKLHAVHFQHSAPRYVDRYSQIFACPVEFDRPTNGLIFPRALLDHVQQHADEVVSHMLRDSADRLMREATPVETLGERVRAELRHHVTLSSATRTHVARSLKLSSVSMSRRLRGEGHTFAALLDEARCRLACEALREEDASIARLAESLGFSEVSAFHRAFKRWTGETPSRYRRQNAGGNVAESDAEGGSSSL